MRKLIALVAALGTLALAGTAVAANDGADVVSESSCAPFAFGTVCTTVKATTTWTSTPSGNLVYATNGKAERTMTFVFGGSYTTTTDIHLVTVQKQGETQASSQRLQQTTSYRSGTYALDCVGGFSLHYANGSTQFSDYSYECTIP
jgi:hypothetical protein